MPSDKNCCIPGCSSKNASGHVLHGFPNPLKDPERFDTWKNKIGAHVFEGLSNEYILKYRHVCRAHFEQRYLCRNGRISSIAVPTINAPDLPSSSISLPRTPLCQKENAGFNAPSSSKDVSSSSTLRSRRSPLSQIKNIVSNVPSTPKDVPSSSILRSRRTPIYKKENYVFNVPSTSKGGKKVVKLSVSTTNEMFFVKNLIATKCKLRRLKSKCLKQSVAIKASKKIFGNPGMLAVLENLPKNAKIFTLLQCRENKKKNKGRHFSNEEKIMGLSLLKASPKGYRKLSKMFILPTQKTLLKLLATANIQPGINKNIFKQLEIQGNKMKPADKLCVLMFDEMAIKCNIAYNERLDKIIGFVTNGNQTKKQFADHALVFMIRGLK